MHVNDTKIIMLKKFITELNNFLKSLIYKFYLLQNLLK